MLTIGSIIEGAFGVLGKRPVSVVVWGLLQLLLAIAVIAAMQPFFAEFANLPPQGREPDPQVLANIMGAMAPIQGLGLLSLVIGIVLWTAALRSVVRPDESSFAYLRIGMDELRMVGVTLIVGIIFYVALVIGVVALVAACLAIDNAGSRPGAVIAGIVGGIVLFCLMLVFGIRMSLAGPLTVYRRKIIIGEAWRLGAGHFWSMFIGYFVVMLLVGVLQSIIWALTTGPMFASMLRSIGDPTAAPRLAGQMMAQMVSIGPASALLWVGIAVIGALRLALYAGAMGTAARLLLHDQGEDLETTFD